MIMNYMDGYHESVTSNQNDWVSATSRAANDSEFYKQFRRDITFLRVIEGTPIEAGYYHLNRLLNNEDFLACLSLIQTSEYIGFPKNLIDFEVDGVPYSLNPTTLRYVNNCINMISLFGSSILSNDVYEIGGGYGGECKIFNDFRAIRKSISLHEYNIFDLNSSKGLINKFLSEFNYKCKFPDIDNLYINPFSTLVISNGALSEMRGELLRSYIDKVVSRCEFGYFLTNFESHSLPYGGITTEEFIQQLKDIGKNVKELDGHKYLTSFDVEVNSKLVVFGPKLYENYTMPLKNLTLWKFFSKLSRVSIRQMFQSRG